jgi:oligoribonuclease
MVWVDVETFGLSLTDDPVLEVGFMVTDIDLQVINKESWIIWSDKHEVALQNLEAVAEAGGDRYVLDMHTHNNLFKEAQAHGRAPFTAEHLMVRWLQEEGTTSLPMCGSSVHMDRGWLRHHFPNVERQFHYRNIDVSTIKELCRRYSPKVYRECPPKDEEHRVLPDLVESTAEFKYYLDNFLKATV